MSLTRMVLTKCANPKCWRHFPKPADSARVCCDDACDIQRTALAAAAVRASTPPSPEGESEC